MVCTKFGGGGLVVSMVASNFDNLSSNLEKGYRFFSQNVV